MAQNLELALILRAKVDEFTKSLQQATGELSSALATMEADAKGAGAGVEAGTAGIERGLEGAAVTAKTAGQSFEQALSKLEMRQRQDIEGDLAAVRQAYDTLATSGKLSAEELAMANLKARDKIAELRREGNDWVGSLGKMRTELAVAGAAVYGLGRTVGNAATASAEFGTAMAEVSTLLDDTSSVDGLSDSVRELSREYGQAPTAQAKALYQIISAGASNAADATTILTAANKLAIGGVTDVATAADGLTSILNAYGAEVGTASDVSDALFVAMKAGKTTIGELSNSIGQVAPLASQAGAGLEEILAATAALTKGGVSTSEAMTQLRGILAAVVKPTKEASDAAEELGLDFSAAALKSKGLAGFLADVQAKTGGSTEAMAKLFGGVEALGGALALTGKASNVFRAILEDMAKKAGLTETAFAKMSETPEMAALRFKAALKDLQISLGQAVTALTPFLEGATGILKAITDLPGPLKSAVLGFGALGTGIAVVAGPLMNLTATAKLAAAAFAAKTSAVGALVPTLSSAGAATLGFAGRIGSLLPQLGLVAAGLYGVWEAGEWLGEALAKLHPITKQAEAAERALGLELAKQIGLAKARVENLDEYATFTARAATEVAGLTEEERAKYAVQLDGHAAYLKATLAVAEAQGEAGKDTVAAQAQIREALTATILAQKDLAAGAKLAAEWADQGLTPAAGALVLELGNLTAAGKSAAEAVQALGKPLDLGSLDGVRDLAAALTQLEKTGELTAHEVGEAWAAALNKLSTEDLERFLTTAQAAFGGTETAALGAAAAMEAGVNAAMKKLGLDLAEVTTGLTTVGTEARTAFGLVVDHAASAGLEGEKAAKVIGAAFDAALSKAKSTEDLQALKKDLEGLGLQGEVAAKAAAALDAKLTPLADKTAPAAAKAVKELGESTEKTAVGATEAAVAIEEVGAAAGEAASGGLPRFKTTLQELQPELAATSAEAVTLFEAFRAATASQQVIGSIEGLGRHLEGLKTRAAGLTLEYAAQKTKLDALVASIRATGDASDQTASMAWKAADQMALLGEEDLATLRSALDDARQKTEDLRTESEDTLAGLRDELARLDKDFVAVERRRYEGQSAELEAKLAAAQAAKDNVAVKNLSEGAALARQIHERRLAEITAERQAEQARHTEALAGRNLEASAATRAQPQRPENPAAAAERQTTQPRGTPLEREYAGMARTVRIEWGNNGPGGEYSERDAERLLEVLRQQGLILS